MKIGVLAETFEGERRVALVPAGIARLAGPAFDVVVRRGPGPAADFCDDAYREAGAVLEADRGSVLRGADVLVAVQAPAVEDIARLKVGTVTISFLQPATQAAVVEAPANGGVTAFSLELLPRISRAQSMDALSSQASLAGYKGVLMAAARLGKFFPMLMTAAGTIPPARVLVLGAGVAGLQAIATARRLGAVVEAYDVRPAVREEVRSLGATFLELELEAEEGQGGYASEQSEEFLTRQRELLTDRVGGSDVGIATPAEAGRRPPVLVTAPMVKRMRRGSVVVDLASETGGNCELTQPGRVIEVDGVWVDGTTNVPSTMALHASQLYSRNVTNLLEHLTDGGVVRIDFDDEITRGACVTHGGEVVNERARQMMRTPQETAAK